MSSPSAAVLVPPQIPKMRVHTPIPRGQRRSASVGMSPPPFNDKGAVTGTGKALSSDGLVGGTVIPVASGLHRRETQDYGPFDGRPLQMLDRAISGEKGNVVTIERWSDACRIGCECMWVAGFFPRKDDERFHH